MLVISQAKELLVQATNMETGMRGFLLAGKEEFLEPYHTGSKAFTDQINELWSIHSITRNSFKH